MQLEVLFQDFAYVSVIFNSGDPTMYLHIGMPSEVVGV